MEVDCRFKFFSCYGYHCVIENIEINQPGTEIINVKGEHERFATNKSLETVRILKSTIEHFPRGLAKIFPNLKFLEINNCGLKLISREDLKGLENLEELHLPNNDLKTLPDDLFCDVRKLHSLSFFGNKLEALSSKLLEPLKKILRYANFQSNTKIDVEYPVRSLRYVMKIIDRDCEKSLQNKPKMIQEDSKTCGFEVLWESRRFSDFTIIAGSKQFPVHKNILGTQSSVFAAIFENDIKERNEEKMEIEDFSAAAVEDFLRFIYTGKILNESNSIELFKLAVKFEVPKLQLTAENLIVYHANEQNAIEIFNLGNLHNSEKLKEVSFGEIEKMFPAIVFTPDLKDKPEAVKELIEGDRKWKQKIKELELQRQREIKETNEKIRKKKRDAEKEFELILKKYKKD